VPDAALLLGILLLSGLTVLIVILIGAVLLRTAVVIYNLLAGGADGQSGVPEPRFLKAMGITLNTTLIIGGLSFLVAVAGRTGSLGGELGATERLHVVAFVLFLFSVVVVACTLTVLLPTSFGTALFVTLCYMVMVAVLVGVVTGLGIAFWKTALL
jgi:hypothetical protein